MSLLFNLINKPWQWRIHLLNHRSERERQWELVDFWHGMAVVTCLACLREKRTLIDRICRECWLLTHLSRPLSPREQIRVNRVVELCS